MNVVSDGVDDFIVGAFNESSGLGAARVYDGGSAMDDVADVEILGTDTSPGRFGYSVAGAGDVNQDGGQDIIVGAYNESSGLGTARIYFGVAHPTDRDGDSVPIEADCDDSDPAVGAPYTRYVDADGDGYGSTTAVTACADDAGYSDNSTDCNDADSHHHTAHGRSCEDHHHGEDHGGHHGGGDHHGSHGGDD